MTNNWSTHYLPPSVLRPSLVALAIALATATMVRAGSVTISNSGPGPAAELDPATRSILEVKDAIKSFEKRDFDGCLEAACQGPGGPSRAASAPCAPCQARVPAPTRAR